MTATLSDSEHAKFAQFFGDQLVAETDEVVAGINAGKPDALGRYERRLTALGEAFARAAGEVDPDWPSKIRTLMRRIVEELMQHAFHRATSEDQRRRAWAT